MTEDTNRKTNDEEINLRKIVELLFHRWKIILVFMLIMGCAAIALLIIMPRQYTATSTVSIDVTRISLVNTSPMNLLNSDFIRAEVAKQIGIPISNLPVVTFSGDAAKTDKTIVMINVISESADLSVSCANVWAEAGVNWYLNNIAQMNQDQIEAQNQVEAADVALFAYLNENEIEQLSWIDLLAISGVGDIMGVIMQYGPNELPVLSIQQRMDLAQLIRQKKLAEWNYDTISKQYFSDTYQPEYKVLLLNRAEKVKTNHIIKLLVPLSIFSGFILGVIWILLSDWCKQSAPNANQ